MSLIRSERSAAALLLGAAALGLILANTGAGPFLHDVQHAQLGALSVGHWISDGLLAIFFFIVAVELKHEFVAGELNSWHKAVRPAIAAVCGVVVPALVYALIAAPHGFGHGWPIPTATDIAFALGVLAVFGRGLPNRLRVFLLALAVLDDLMAIVIIAVFFTTGVDPGMLLAAAACVAAFGLLSLLVRRGGLRLPILVLLVIAGVLAWWYTYQSGIHATIAGVALGAVMARRPAGRITHRLEPWSNGLVLPLFAFSAALVTVPAVGLSGLSAPFWAILVALPVGKIIGITFGGWIGSFVGRGGGHPPLPLRALVAVGALGGIGFTVSLLMNELAFSDDHTVADQGTLAVLLGSAVSIVVSAVLVALLARRNRREHPITS
ncbi:Na+/H+ antiporter NhaA [Gryllotalpicola ginsengisoli]|uniref:Na+/H+ antiporter NhaA n=1 Tax=Gryllotalpicola ginsengisoli TaxID=444608 RepID=UPI0003B599ED|nr:Na+/H+ antiporter NhaA [Gryllotalpicola ginsengisoli]